MGLARFISPGGVFHLMVTLDCDPYPPEVRRHIETQLVQDNLTNLALAFPNLEVLQVNPPTDVTGTSIRGDDYFHLLPHNEPDVTFVVCIEQRQTDHRLFEKYRENMNVIVVDSIDEYTCITNEDVYFAEGKRARTEVINEKGNLCDYNESLETCIDTLFTIKETYRVDG